MPFEPSTTNFGVPRAPVLRSLNPVQIAFERVKQTCLARLPILGRDEILKYTKPHQSLFQKLLAGGYHQAVEEILNLKELEEDQVQNCARKEAIIITNANLLGKIAETLQTCIDHERNNEHFQAANRRFTLGQDLMGSKDFWLADHFFKTALALVKSLKDDESKQFKAKTHCLIAYMGWKDFDKRSYSSELIKKTIRHLESSRRLCRGKDWWFSCSNLMKLFIKKPIAVYGIRDERLQISCSNQSIFNVATIIYFDILMDMIGRTLSMHSTPNKEDIEISFKLAFEALGLAKEIGNQTAILSALIRAGVLLREQGKFIQAEYYFQQLLHGAELHNDFDSQAIACGNLAYCLQGRRLPVEALTWLDQQREISYENGLLELDGDSIRRTGHILLQEGHAVEAEQCYFEAYYDLLKATSGSQYLSSSSFKSSNLALQRSKFDSTISLRKPRSVVSLAGTSRSTIASFIDPPERDDDAKKPSKMVSVSLQVERGTSMHKQAHSTPSSATDLGKSRSKSESKALLKTKRKLPDKAIVDTAWVFAGIGAGTHLWGRLAGHCRLGQENPSSFMTLLNFKGVREPMAKVPSPNFEIQDIYEFFQDFDDEKVPITDSLDELYILANFQDVIRMLGEDPEPILSGEKRKKMKVSIVEKAELFRLRSRSRSLPSRSTSRIELASSEIQSTAPPILNQKSTVLPVPGRLRFKSVPVSTSTKTKNIRHIDLTKITDRKDYSHYCKDECGPSIHPSVESIRSSRSNSSAYDPGESLSAVKRKKIVSQISNVGHVGAMPSTFPLRRLSKSRTARTTHFGPLPPGHQTESENVAKRGVSINSTGGRSIKKLSPFSHHSIQSFFEKEAGKKSVAHYNPQQSTRNLSHATF